MPGAAEREHAAAPPHTGARAHAFGLDLALEFPVAGLEPGEGGGARRARVEQAAGHELDAAWRAGAAERVSEHRDRAGRVVAAIDRHPEHGWLLAAEGYGRLWLSRSGEHLRCADDGAPRWRLDHFVVGQGLPFASVLQGLEAMHASALAVGGRAVALSGHAGSGKTSAAVALALAGDAELMTDDVLALEPHDGGLLAHPGAAAVSIRRSAADLVARGAPGAVLGEDRETVRLRFPRHAHAEPLGAVFLLERGDVARVEIEAAAAEAPLLLGTSFNFLVDTPERRARQLDAYSRLAGCAALTRVTVPAGMGAFALADALREAL